MDFEHPAKTARFRIVAEILRGIDEQRDIRALVEAKREIDRRIAYIELHRKGLLWGNLSH